MAHFARQTIDDWLAVLAAGQPAAEPTSDRSMTEHTLALSVLGGALLDRLATGDIHRTTAAVDHYLRLIAPTAN